MPYHVIDLLPAYLDRDDQALNRRQREQIAAHLRVCGSCAAALERMADQSRELYRTMPSIGRPSADQLRRMRQHILAESWPTRQVRAQVIRRWSSIGVTLGATLSVLVLIALFFSTPTYANAAPPQSADQYMHTQTGQIAVRHTNTPIAGDSVVTVLNVTPAPITASGITNPTGNPAPSPDPSIAEKRNLTQ